MLSRAERDSFLKVCPLVGFHKGVFGHDELFCQRTAVQLDVELSLAVSRVGSDVEHVSPRGEHVDSVVEPLIVLRVADDNVGLRVPLNVLFNDIYVLA